MYIVFSVQIQVPDERDGSGDAVPGSAAVKLVSLWSVDFFHLNKKGLRKEHPRITYADVEFQACGIYYFKAEGRWAVGVAINGPGDIFLWSRVLQVWSFIVIFPDLLTTHV